MMFSSIVIELIFLKKMKLYSQLHQHLRETFPLISLRQKGQTYNNVSYIEICHFCTKSCLRDIDDIDTWSICCLTFRWRFAFVGMSWSRTKKRLKNSRIVVPTINPFSSVNEWMQQRLSSHTSFFSSRKKSSNQKKQNKFELKKYNPFCKKR